MLAIKGVPLTGSDFLRCKAQNEKQVFLTKRNTCFFVLFMRDQRLGLASLRRRSKEKSMSANARFSLLPDGSTVKERMFLCLSRRRSGLLASVMLNVLSVSGKVARVW